jgi:hypothetical protein
LDAPSSRIGKIAQLLIFSFVALLITACVAVPQQELTSYREAFLETQKAGQLLYDDLAASVVRAGGGPQKSNCVRGRAAPACFDPNVARDDGAVADIPDIRARRLALESVEIYNLAVVDLLEGKRGDALTARIGELRDVAGDLLGLASVGAGPLPALVTGQSAALLGELVRRIDTLAAGQQARASLIENAKLVNEMIRLLIADTPAMYTLYKTSQGKYAVELELSGGTGNKAAMEAYAKIGAYHDQLTAYVKLLDQTKSSFAQLIGALETGAGSTADLRAAIREAIEIRKASEAFWAEVRKAK